MLQYGYESDSKTLSGDVMERIALYVENPDFTPDRVGARTSTGWAALCAWVRAMYHYNSECRRLMPQMERLREAQAKLEMISRALHNKSVPDFEIFKDRVEGLRQEGEHLLRVE